MFLVVITLFPSCRNTPDPSETPQQANQAATRLDQPGLEDTEDKTEAFANGLLDLSMVVKQQESHKLNEYFAEEVIATPFPFQPLEEHHRVKWVGEHGWELNTSPVAMDRDTFWETG